MRKLIVKAGASPGTEIPINNRIVIGREEECDVVVADPNVSRRHAEVVNLDGMIAAVDLNSSNGTFVNELPISRVFLINGDELRLGETIFEYVDDESDMLSVSGAATAAPVRLVSMSDGGSIARSASDTDSLAELNRTRMFAAIPEELQVDALKDVYLRLKALYRVFHEVAQAGNLKEITEAACRAATVTLNAQRATYLLNAERSGGSWQRFFVHTASGMDQRATARPEAADVLERVRESRAAVLAHVDNHGHAHYTGHDANTIAVPTIRGGAIIGILYVDNPGSLATFSKDDVDFVTTVALQISVRMGQVEQVQQLRQENIQLRHKAEEDSAIIVQNENMKRILAVTGRVAETESSVLITGESGTGKELIARTIHNFSPRRSKPLVAVNCAALPETLLESELFGHEKGAFTGAHERRVGKFELADNGSLFLDEIGDISPAAQAKLLRALQEGEIQRVGGMKTIKVNVRLIAATNKNLAEEVQKGNFRQDLFFRIRVIELAIPPLRERPEDIAVLAEYFLKQLRQRIPTAVRSLSPAAIAALQRYPFPGNVRELRNVIERGLVFAEGDTLLPEHLPVEIFQNAGNAPGAVPSSPASFTSSDGQPLSLSEVEKLHIANVLQYVKGNKLRAASLLGISRTTLYEKLRLYEIGTEDRP